MKDWDRAFTEQLFEAASYRDFIRLFFHRDKEITRPKKLTFGEFAQRSDFASKAYLNDVIAGRKRLTPASFDKVAIGLGLNALWTKYLKALVGREENKFHSPGKDAVYYQSQVQKNRTQIERRLSVASIAKSETKAQRILLSPSFPEVYASLGDLQTGETLEGIQRKTRLNREELDSALADLELIGLVRFDKSKNRYIPKALAVESYGLEDSEIFKNDFFRSIEKTKQRFPKQATSKDSLFMTQSFSVRSDQLAELRKQLAETIENFATQAENSRGDCISEISVSFTHNL